MKLLVMGLDCAAPELLFGDEELVNLRRLMEVGCYGPLESVIPPITIPAWMCMATSRDPWQLSGFYGFRNRQNWSYDALFTVNSKSFTDLAIWDQVAREGRRAHVIGVPPGYPPRKTSGYSIGCFLTPDTASDAYTRRNGWRRKSANCWASDYRVDVRGFRTDNKDWLKDEIHTMTRPAFSRFSATSCRPLNGTTCSSSRSAWIGCTTAFGNTTIPSIVTICRATPTSRWLEITTDCSMPKSARCSSCWTRRPPSWYSPTTAPSVLDGGFCVNEWLIREGLLVLNRYPDSLTSMSDLDVNWDRTTAWSEGGYYARVFLNVKGRERCGTIDPADYERVRDDVKARLEGRADDNGKPMNTRVFKPQEIYRQVRNLAPDLIVYFGDLYWRSVGKVGYQALHVQENDTGPDDCNHAQYGAFHPGRAGLLRCRGRWKRCGCSTWRRRF